MNAVPRETIDLIEKNRRQRIEDSRQLALRIQATDDGFCPMCGSEDLRESSKFKAIFTYRLKVSCDVCGYEETFVYCE